MTWRQHIWGTLHHLAANYDPKNRERDPFWVFWATMPRIIPCSTCQNEWAKISSEVPVSAWIDKDPREVLHLTVFLHNKVNTRLGKPLMSYEEADRIYLHSE